MLIIETGWLFPVLRIRIRNPDQVFFDPWIRDKSGSGIRDPGSGFLCKKYLNSLSTQCCGAGSGIRDLVLIGPGSGIRCLLTLDPGSGAYWPWIRDPVLIDPGSGIRCLLTLDPGSEMAKKPDPGSDINIPGPQHYSDHSSLGTPIPLNTAQWTVKDAGGGGGRVQQDPLLCQS